MRIVQGAKPAHLQLYDSIDKPIGILLERTWDSEPHARPTIEECLIEVQAACMYTSHLVRPDPLNSPKGTAARIDATTLSSVSSPPPPTYRFHLGPFGEARDGNYTPFLPGAYPPNRTAEGRLGLKLSDSMEFELAGDQFTSADTSSEDVEMEDVEAAFRDLTADAEIKYEPNISMEESRTQLPEVKSFRYYVTDCEDAS